jgi:hypothetical protein
MSLNIEDLPFATIVSPDGTKTVLTYNDARIAVRAWEKKEGRLARVGDAIPLCNLAAGDRIVIDHLDMDGATFSLGTKP